MNNMNLAIRCACVIAGAVLTLASTWAAVPPLDDPNQPYDQFSMEIVTPHVAWANPSLTGPLNALVIAPCWQFRDTVELAQRLELNITPLMVSDNQAYYGAGESMKDLDADLDELADLRLAEGRRYQVIFIGKVAWDVLPERVRSAILRKVAQGTGLVYVSPTGGDAALEAALADRQYVTETNLLAGVPIEVMPLELAKDDYTTQAIGPFDLRLSTLGQGRVAVVDYHDLEPAPSSRLHWAAPFQIPEGPWYDYYFAIVARAAQWAARRELPISVTPLLKQGSVIARENLGASTPQFLLNAPPPELAGTATLRWRLRNTRDEAVFKHEETVQLKTAREATLALPTLPAGLYLLDLRVVINGQTAGWGSLAMNVSAPGFIEGITLSSPIVKPGEAIAGQVRLARPLEKGMTLRLTTYDRLGRLVADNPLKTSGQTADFTFSLTDPVGCIFDVRAVVQDHQGEIEECEVQAFIPDPRPGENFMFTQWGKPSGEPLTRAATEQMKRVGGMTGFYDSILHSVSSFAPKAALAGARQGLKPLPYCTTFIVPKDKFEETPDGLALRKDTPWSGHDLNNPKALAAATAKMTTIAQAYAGCDVIAYSINEEGGVPPGESCFCEHCKRGFTAYARRKYGTLEAANRIWGTAYTTWEAVRGGVIEDALQSNRFARWLDQRLFMLESYNRWQRACIDGFRAVDPQASIGPNVVVAVDRSFDIPALGSEWGLFGHNADYMNAVARSFLPPGALSENESGNLPMEETYHRYWPWNAFLQGQSHIFWYPRFHSRGLGGIATLFPDLRPFACYQQTGDEVREIQQTIGPLVRQGEMVLSPVAIHWSTLSYFLDIVHHPETRWLDALRDAFHVVADAGLGYRYVGTPQIESGALKDIRVLFLPYCQVLTDAEAAAIRVFVENGGLLLADFLPGMYDAHGLKRPHSTLADLFSDTTELAVNASGKGHAVLTGQALKGYTGRRGSGAAGDRRGLMRMIETLTDVVPWCRIETLAGLDRGDTEISLFRHGETLLLGLIRDPGVRAELASTGGEWTVRRNATGSDDPTAATTVVRLPAAYHVYDVRRQDYLGCTNVFQTGLTKGHAKVFALLPHRLTGLKMTLNTTQPRPGAQIKLRLAAVPAEAACNLGLRIEVTAPDGEICEPYTRTLIAPDSRLTTTFTLALDEAPGDYRIKATEVISGQQAEATYTVQKRK